MKKKAVPRFELLVRPGVPAWWWWGALAWGLALAGVSAWVGWALVPVQAVKGPAPVWASPSGEAGALSRSAPDAPVAYAESARDALAQHGNWWEPAVRALEDNPVAGLKLLSVDITSADRMARIQLDAPSVEAVLGLVDRLNAQAPSKPAPWSLQSLESLAPENGVSGVGAQRAVLHWQPAPARP